MGENESASGSSSLPTSPREMSPLPTEEVNGKIENGSTSVEIANGNGNGVGVANGNGEHAESAS